MSQGCEGRDKLIPIISNLLTELASELDLHYEDADFFALEPTISRMVPAIELLQRLGAPVPEAVSHVMRRYQRSHHLWDSGRINPEDGPDQLLVRSILRAALGAWR